MQNHNIQINDRRANAAINEEDVHRLARAMSGWYVRMDGKYYDASDPKNKYSRDDVQAASTFRFQEDYPEIPLSEELLREVFETALTKKTFDRSLAVPTWNGKVQCLPGQQDRFSWKHGMVTINTWTEPAYRSVEVAEGALGTIGDFLDFIFDTEREKDIFLNWLAWCLQNEDQKPTWGPLLYSKSKGTGKSTLCDIARALFGKGNSIRQNNVDKLTGQFNLQVLLSKLVISEELDIRPGTKAANALKTFMTETDASAEAKGRELQRIDQCFAAMFTSNHLPLWIEENDRRYWVVGIEHDGRAGGARSAEFGELVGNLYAYLVHDAHLAEAYAYLMQRDLPEGFSGKAFNVAELMTPAMELIFGNGARTSNEILQEYLDEKGLNWIPQKQLTEYITGELRGNVNALRHSMTELGWKKAEVKFGGRDYRRSVWVRPGFTAAGGKLIHPDGTSELLINEDERMEDHIYGRNQVFEDNIPEGDIY